MKLQSYGWCSQRAKIMNVVCPVTCQFCFNKDSRVTTTKSTTTKSSTRMKVRNENCSDKRYDCPRLKQQGWCVTYRKYLFTRCKKTCGFCEHSSITTTIRAPTTTTSTTATTTRNGTTTGNLSRRET